MGKGRADTWNPKLQERKPSEQANTPKCNMHPRQAHQAAPIQYTSQTVKVVKRITMRMAIVMVVSKTLAMLTKMTIAKAKMSK